MKTLDGFQVGKPVIVEETFPLGCSQQELESFMDQAGQNADGWVSFFWGKMPEEYAPEQSIAAVVTATWISAFSDRMKAEAETEK